MEECEKVSIIIPVYNGANYLREAIESALNQDYPNIEVLVINDGSNDNNACENIAKEYGDRIRYFYKENGGVATALNYGIEKMTGTYFSWLSHDDVYFKNKISAEMEAITAVGDDCIIGCGYKVVDRDRNFLYEINPLKEYGKEKLELPLFPVFHCCINGCALLIPKSHFERVGYFDENLPTTQDYDLWFRMLRGRKMRFIDGAYLYSRSHDEQDSRKKYSEHIRECNELWIHLFDSITIEEKCKMGEGSELIFLCQEKQRFLQSDYVKVVEYLDRKILELLHKENNVHDIKKSEVVAIVEYYDEKVYELEKKVKAIDALRSEINLEKNYYQKCYRDICNSTCWKMTGFLRKILDIMK